MAHQHEPGLAACIVHIEIDGADRHFTDDVVRAGDALQPRPGGIQSRRRRAAQHRFSDSRLQESLDLRSPLSFSTRKSAG
ncbi:hypothetical protein GGD63_004272 [Bradyrhizobium sp. cir1]|nr:hypothetical protein [Bradyrhizobium sp. cir1]